MLAGVDPATMNFPFPYPYEDDDMSSAAQSMLDPSAVMTMTMTAEDVLLPRSQWPVPNAFSFQQPRPQQRNRSQSQSQEQVQTYHRQKQQHQWHEKLDSHVPSPPSSSASSSPSPAYPSTATTAYKSETSRWRALVARDALATDAFVYAVITTKIYCRPNCSARLARRANVRFFDLAQQAERGGFRACKRCKPNSRAKSARVVEGVSSSAASSSSSSSSPEATPTPGSASGAEAELVACRNIAPASASASASAETSPEQYGDANTGTGTASAADYGVELEEDIHTKIDRAVHLVRQAASASENPQPLSLSQLSAQVGLSKWHLQRVFKKLQGVTPREMAEEIIRAKQTTSTVLGVSLAAHAVSDEKEMEEEGEWYASGLSASRPSDINVGYGLAQPPSLPLPLPLLDSTGTGAGLDWFDEDALFDSHYNQPQYQHQQHQQHQQQEEEQLPLPVPVPVPFADCARQTLTMPMDLDMEMDMVWGIDMDMDMDLNLHAASEVEGLLNDLFPEILVY
ncbi:uncharacterized protein Z520_00316 [Fonsecaea multimorphosa CBS 102226]|uniref:HTH araC/xylS-type domain-containing protein n=1 Tax=Fonsecaea multimorphosa CBS 102226 TaxID=1442371 RepID=A0A0D2KJF5_9EURO|nr:uncharacterized protein Z520_00316 [Fonsecaea multimorphosa CBS 102226]KIY03625.1 hypothetical protein Z520_00316 [Fonsecaea multimorphosa CBS 102226]OAL32326.1 hypothetical protein AYO22_00348 [Fonsecaea multimorphosa]